MGWRYQYILIGGLCLGLAIIRVFFMNMEESCKWLVAQERFEEAIQELQKVARINGVQLDITADVFESDRIGDEVSAETKAISGMLFGRLRGLFATRRLMISTTGVALLWMCIGIA